MWKKIFTSNSSNLNIKNKFYTKNNIDLNKEKLATKDTNLFSKGN